MQFYFSGFSLRKIKLSSETPKGLKCIIFSVFGAEYYLLEDLCVSTHCVFLFNLFNRFAVGGNHVLIVQQVSLAVS